MESVLTGAAANTVSSVVSVAIAPLNQLIDDVVHLKRNTQLLEAQLNRMKSLLVDITNRFQQDQRSAPETVKNWLQRLHQSLDDAKLVVDRAQPHKRCLQCFLCRPTFSTQVREWNANFDRLFVDFERDFSILGNTERTVSSAPLLPGTLLLPVPPLGFVGSDIEDHQMQLQRWVDNEDHQFRIIGVFGIIGHNNISVLPPDFSCPNLLTLMLGYNESLREVPDGFLVNLTSLRVLDLSTTKIESLPMSLWHLTQLEYLNLEDTLIKDVPEDICNLSQLQFLRLNSCKNLESLSPKIRELEKLKTLDLNNCCRLTGIPREISQLTSLNILLLGTSETVENSIMEVEEVQSRVCSLKDLTNCSNLVQLEVHVKAGIEVEGIRAGIKAGIMESWLEMRDLTMRFDVEDHDVLEDLPQDMQSMRKLQRFGLSNYHGRSLPNCICEFPQLERLVLYRCFQLSNLPPLEKLLTLRSLSLKYCTKLKELGIGTWGSVTGFPMLESLRLKDLPVLESLASSSSDVVWNEQTLPKLHVLTIRNCSSLKGLPLGIDKLPNLESIEVEKDWWENNDVEISFKEKLHHLIVFIE